MLCGGVQSTISVGESSSSCQKLQLEMGFASESMAVPTSVLSSLSDSSGHGLGLLI